MAHDVKKEVRTYMIVFGSLMVLTILTVAVANLHLGSMATAIVVGLMIAVVKASLVALYFMHLSHERRFIYWNLLLCAVFLVALFGLPLWAFYDHLDRKGRAAEVAVAEDGPVAVDPVEKAPTLEGVTNQGGARTATIKGKVVYVGKERANRPIDVSGNPDCKGLYQGGPGLFSEGYVIGAQGELANVAVYISEGVNAKDFEPPTEPVILDQKACRYDPHVITVMARQPLKIRNSDPFMHNVNSQPASNPKKNSPMPKGSSDMDFTFRRAEKEPFAFRCDVHTWMNAWVAVLPHPYHGVTGDDGTFEFKEKIAPGTYILTAWHERLGKVQKKIEVADGEVKEVETFEFGK